MAQYKCDVSEWVRVCVCVCVCVCGWVVSGGWWAVRLTWPFRHCRSYKIVMRSFERTIWRFLQGSTRHLRASTNMSQIWTGVYMLSSSHHFIPHLLHHPPSPSTTLPHPPSPSLTLPHPPSSSLTLPHPPSPSLTLPSPCRGILGCRPILRMWWTDCWSTWRETWVPSPRSPLLTLVCWEEDGRWVEGCWQGREWERSLVASQEPPGCGEGRPGGPRSDCEMGSRLSAVQQRYHCWRSPAQVDQFWFHPPASLPPDPSLPRCLLSPSLPPPPWLPTVPPMATHIGSPANHLKCVRG